MVLLVLLISFSTIALGQEQNTNGVTPRLDCVRDHCEKFGNRPYHRVIVGQIDGVGNAQDVAGYFAWARQHGYWHMLPQQDDASFQAETRMVWLRFDTPTKTAEQKTQRIAVPMDAHEFEVFGWQKGDWVRYAPHNPTHPVPATLSPAARTVYQQLTGCVLFLCRPSQSDCAKFYQSGVYSRDKGIAAAFDDDALLSDSPAIDIKNYRSLSLISPTQTNLEEQQP